MMYWDGNMGVWGYILMGVSFVLFWAAIITAIILFARSMGAGSRRYEGGAPGAGVAENLLAERFARGEIDESEYTARLAVLRRGRGA
ncbi:SHOCT domain-containing protein [Pseudarthrobacter cellobiosi]|uniref:SHOCT domain-containing protein n=1 Tax=Pseudarthrobacter cellobiosi TaxID=2953654 RepID=UPI00208F6E24|nr:MULTISPECIES: SHOCT domain-containing protein [unclassified Pseudarthrobacter]MCO4255576.1 SHOCT domain-containing protein [Pseudarthrobacter sp. HLT1-5]MCO4273606.1 SHOCT domain-containing protein [Pseudarthrobacter sp. HLT3-5]